MLLILLTSPSISLQSSHSLTSSSRSFTAPKSRLIMQLTRAHVEAVMAPYLHGDFAAFVREGATPDFVFELVPGNLTSKLGTTHRQHEFSGTFDGHDAAIKMILEGLTGNEVKVCP